MTDAGLRDVLGAMHENSDLYLILGALAAVLSWVLFAPLGLVAVYCGYKLYTRNRSVSAALIALVGGGGFLVWLALILSI